MVWMGIWVHPYAVICVQVGVRIRKNGVWPSLYDVVVSWLRLQTPIDSIPHPYWMYTKCLSTLRCFGWAWFIYPIHGVIHMTVKLMPGGLWHRQYTRVVHAPRRWSWISQPINSSCINRRGTTITSRYASRVQHLIPFQNSSGIITDMVVGGRGRLLGREHSLQSSIATLFCIPRLWRMKTSVWLNSSTVFTGA